MLSDYLIDATGVTISYPNERARNERIVIINDASLKVRPRDLVTVVGPSGCGKSTLLRLVLGSQFPTAGTVLVDGEPVTRVTGDCGIVYQNYSLFDFMSVVDNIALGPILSQSNIIQRLLAKPLAPFNRWQATTRACDFISKAFRVTRQARERARGLLADIGLEQKDGDKLPYELSGGMRQRVAFAQALMMDPKILLMDEAFSGLDMERRLRMQDFVHEQWDKHKLTIFFVTHDLPEACKLGTRLVLLSQYWCDNDGKPGKGAKILIDRKVDGGPAKPRHMAQTDEFDALINQITSIDRDNRLPLASFDLSHPDATPLKSAA